MQVRLPLYSAAFVELTFWHRRRRIKCDQGRPACQRCISSARTCDILPITSHSVAKSPGISDCRILTEPNSVLSTFNTQQQWDMFSVFLFINEQAGTLPVNILSSLTPQIAQQDVAVREICCAIGAAANAFTHPDSDPSADEAQYKLSLVHYNRALRCIREANSSTSALLTVAVVSILFVTYDMIRGDMVTAFAHFDHGHRITEAYFDERCKETGLPFSQLPLSTLESALFDIVQRLTTHPWALELGFDGCAVNHKLHNWAQDRKHTYLVKEMPASFKDLAETLRWWDVTQYFLVHRAQTFVSDKSSRSSPVSSPDIDSQNANKETWDEPFWALDQWHNSFAPLLQSAKQKKDEDPYTYLHAYTLETLYLETLTSLHLYHRRDSNVLPDVKPIYLDMMRTTREMQQRCNKPSEAAVLDNAIIRPLMFVLYKCRDADVRQSIKEILEGVDQSSRMAMPLLTMMERKQETRVSSKLRNIERSLGWYFTACGCSSGAIHIR
ncbi:hypothetical protein AK830_g2724 [Neonectria ditissima]|uniref:Zn(2)-C6 fungal-type domain-containing protein n=1 Tax=Neonectria ditissima TaxID=78410 RepID=A0A0P7BU27_9HYPO|nr:hypothetical protein AK830_g2724 [Neonectria ditissima]